MSDTSDVGSVSLVWLDNSQVDSDDHVATDQLLRCLDPKLTIYDAVETFVASLKSYPDGARFVLVTSGRLGQEAVPGIHENERVMSIYVFCCEKEPHEKWAKEYIKVKGVVTDADELVAKIRSDHFKSPVAAAVEAPESEGMDAEQANVHVGYKMDLKFRLSQIYVDCLIRMPPTPTEQDEMVSFFQTKLHGQSESLSMLGAFKEGYSASSALNWLEIAPALFQIIEIAFKQANVSELIVLRPLIRDMKKQLEAQKCTSSVRVFCYERVSDEVLQELKRSDGQIIAFKSFLATDRLARTAQATQPSSSSPDLTHSVLFAIDANPEISGAQTFGTIEPPNTKGENRRVLFMIGSLFKITKITEEKDGTTHISMTPCADENQDRTKAMIDSMKSQYIDANGATNMMGLHRLLCDIGGSLNEASLMKQGEASLREYCNQSTAEPSMDLVRCYDTLGKSDFAANQLDQSLKWHEKSIKMKTELNWDPRLTIENYKYIVMIYFQKQDYSQSLDYTNKLLAIVKDVEGDNRHDLIFAYLHLNSIYEAERKPLDAVAILYQALAIMIKLEPVPENSLAGVYYNLANMHCSLGNHDLAVGYYKASLKIKVKLHPPIHISVGRTHRNLAIAYQQLEMIPQAREHFEQAMSIYGELEDSDPQILLDIKESIQNLSPTTDSTVATD